MTTAINLKTAELRHLPAQLSGVRVSQATDPAQYPEKWAAYAGTEPIPTGYRATGWTAELRPSGGWRIPVLEERDLDAEKLASLDPHIATIQSLIQANYAAGFDRLPGDSYDAAAMAQVMLESATLEQTKAAVLYKHLRDTLTEAGVRWADIVWFEQYAVDHPEVWS